MTRSLIKPRGDHLTPRNSLFNLGWVSHIFNSCTIRYRSVTTRKARPDEHFNRIFETYNYYKPMSVFQISQVMKVKIFMTGSNEIEIS